jgi:hypothetical protein
MLKKRVLLEVNDYLDLYLLAGALGDKLWQDEMITKLETLKSESNQEDPILEIHNLWLEYKKINAELIDLYHQLRKDSTNEGLHREVGELKRRRMDICHKIYDREQRKS